MNRAIAVATAVLLVLFAVAAAQNPKVEVPKLSTELDDFGARPGTFHFVTNEQTLANVAELQKAYAALDALDSKIAQLDPATRSKLSPEVAQLKTFVSGVHQQSTASAGKTAQEIEARLTAAKGNFMCGACHGPGMGMMMHRGNQR